MKFCIGCQSCMKRSEDTCPLITDGIMSIVDKMKEADGFIFTTPIYGMNVSAQLKVLFDRNSYWFHRPTLFGKPTLSICATDIGGIRSNTKYLRHMLEAYSMRYIGGIGVLSGPFKNDESYLKRIDKKLKKMSAKYMDVLLVETLPEPTAKEIVKFTAWKTKSSLSKDIYQYDFQFWKDNGYLEADYFYPIKNSIKNRIIKNVVGKGAKKLLVKRLGLRKQHD